MRKRTDVVHVIAYCKTCGWETQAYKNGQALAAKHAKSHKHHVFVEVGLISEYDGTEER